MSAEERAADTWEPLIAIADAAGGQWPTAARAACIAMVNRADDDDTTPGQQLLIDVHACLGAMDFISSSDLCTRLRMMPESPWMDDNLTMHKLGRMLTEYGIKSKKSHDRTHRGYYSKDFADAWSRYLPKQASKKCPGHALCPGGLGVVHAGRRVSRTLGTLQNAQVISDENMIRTQGGVWLTQGRSHVA